MKKILYYIFIFPLVCIKNGVDPNWWASYIGNKSGTYEKSYNSKVAKWSRSLTGWKWWAWQIGGGLLGVIVFEFLLNLIGLSMLPWRW